MVKHIDGQNRGVIVGINEIKELLIGELELIGFNKVSNDEIPNPKLANIYKLDRECEIYFALDKDGDKNVFEILAHGQCSNGNVGAIRKYDEYTELLAELKYEEDYLKAYVLSIVEIIEESFKQN